MPVLIWLLLLLPLLQTAEFMGSDPLMAALGLRIALIAYPVVALSKVSSACVLFGSRKGCAAAGHTCCMLAAHLNMRQGPAGNRLELGSRPCLPAKLPESLHSSAQQCDKTWGVPCRGMCFLQVFLEEVHGRLLAAPDDFQGML